MVEPLLLITNSQAGTSDQAEVDRALAVLRAATDVEVCATGNPGELDGVLHRRGSRQVVVAGGDGSLHAVVAALHRRQELDDVTVGLIPLGTGNDFARGAGVPLDTAEAARVVVAGHTRRVDLLVDCTGQVVVNNVHIGTGAEASRRASGWKELLGRPGYVVGALLTAMKPPTLRLRVEVDGEEIADFSRKVLMVAIGNGPQVGGGTEITPEASPLDGKMDVMVSFSAGKFARFGYALKFRVGRHHWRRDVHYGQARQVTVAGEPFYCSADGEVYGPERHRSWHVEPEAMTMLLPA